MHVNIIHRPEPDPYRRKIFAMQQDMVHEQGLPVTILATAPALEDEETVKLMKKYEKENNDEIGISFHTLDIPSIVDLVGYKEVALWLYDEADKRKVIRYLIQKFKEVFGYAPTSAGSYHMDASATHILLEECPSIKTMVGGCFEEGVRVYHGCNNSWYIFNEGMAWGPWYPSKTNSLRPAKNENDAFDVVAVPHLTRDMVLAYEGRNDFWASHPPNVQRGMGNKGEFCPYDKNLIDQHRYQEQFNNGFSYLNVFVSAQWLIHNHNSEEPPSVSISLYQQQLEYIKSLVDSGDVVASTMTEFGEWYKKNMPVNHREVSVAKEILYGSGKHYFWFINPNYRALIDLSQGCSIGDLRAYVGEVEISLGPDSKDTIYGSYPYIIQSQHRTGYPNHFSDGSRTTAIVKHGDIEVDMAEVEFKIDKVFDDQKGFVTKPAIVKFGDEAEASIITTVHFDDNDIIVERELVELKSKTGNSIQITEYIKGCHGKTEYPEDMTGVKLTIDGDADKTFDYAYKRKAISKGQVSFLKADIPHINTSVEYKPADGEKWQGVVEEGILFNPYFTLKLIRNIEPNNNSKICLSLKTMK